MIRYEVMGQTSEGRDFWAIFYVKDGVVRDDAQILINFWGWPLQKALSEMRLRGWTVERVDG